MNKLKEIEIKHKLKNHIFNKDKKSGQIANNFIITEFSISNFSRRVDLVYFSKNKTIAFEIKSEFDSLLRLKDQTEEYLKYFDKVVVVGAKKHIEKIKNIVPENVAIWELAQDKIKVIRKGKIKYISEKLRFIRMMTLVELIKLCTRNNICHKNKKRSQIEINLTSLSTSHLKKEAIRCIKSRYKKRNNNFFEHGESIFFKEQMLNYQKEKDQDFDITTFIEALKLTHD